MSNILRKQQALKTSNLDQSLVLIGITKICEEVRAIIMQKTSEWLSYHDGVQLINKLINKKAGNTLIKSLYNGNQCSISYKLLATKHYTVIHMRII